jgi:hypothetical protein
MAECIAGQGTREVPKPEQLLLSSFVVLVV